MSKPKKSRGGQPPQGHLGSLTTRRLPATSMVDCGLVSLLLAFLMDTNGIPQRHSPRRSSTRNLRSDGLKTDERPRAAWRPLVRRLVGGTRSAPSTRTHLAPKRCSRWANFDIHWSGAHNEQAAPNFCLHTRHFQIAPDAIELAESRRGRHDPNRSPSPRVASHEFLTVARALTEPRSSRAFRLTQWPIIPSGRSRSSQVRRSCPRLEGGCHRGGGTRSHGAVTGRQYTLKPWRDSSS
jgi:hypothetical protein